MRDPEAQALLAQLCPTSPVADAAVAYTASQLARRPYRQWAGQGRRAWIERKKGLGEGLRALAQEAVRLDSATERGEVRVVSRPAVNSVVLELDHYCQLARSAPHVELPRRFHDIRAATEFLMSMCENSAGGGVWYRSLVVLLAHADRLYRDLSKATEVPASRKAVIWRFLRDLDLGSTIVSGVEVGGELGGMLWLPDAGPVCPEPNYMLFRTKLGPERLACALSEGLLPVSTAYRSECGRFIVVEPRDDLGLSA